MPFAELYAEIVSGVTVMGASAFYKINKVLQDSTEMTLPNLGMALGTGIMLIAVLDCVRRLRSGDCKSLVTIIEAETDEACRKAEKIVQSIEKI